MHHFNSEIFSFCSFCWEILIVVFKVDSVVWPVFEFRLTGWVESSLGEVLSVLDVPGSVLFFCVSEVSMGVLDVFVEVCSAGKLVLCLFCWVRWPEMSHFVAFGRVPVWIVEAHSL